MLVEILQHSTSMGSLPKSFVGRVVRAWEDPNYPDFYRFEYTNEHVGVSPKGGWWIDKKYCRLVDDSDLPKADEPLPEAGSRVTYHYKPEGYAYLD